ncbi:hypothetical protein ACOSQ2_020734 [Xanthoceras sorbifolium]
MLHFFIYVKHVNQRCDLHVIEPWGCSVISIINDAKKELFGCHQPLKKKYEPLSLLQYNVALLDPVVDDVEMVDMDLNKDHGIPQPNDVELRDSDIDFQPDDVSSEDSYVNLVDGNVNGDHPVEQYDTDGNPLSSDHSSNDENGLLKIVRYCAQNQWVPNDDESIEFCPG